MLLYPCTFDPITNGNVDILRRACSLADRLIVAVASSKEKAALFYQEERLEMVFTQTQRSSVDTGTTTKSVALSYLLVEFIAKIGAIASKRIDLRRVMC